MKLFVPYQVSAVLCGRVDLELPAFFPQRKVPGTFFYRDLTGINQSRPYHSQLFRIIMVNLKKL